MSFLSAELARRNLRQVADKCNSIMYGVIRGMYSILVARGTGSGAVPVKNIPCPREAGWFNEVVFAQMPISTLKAEAEVYCLARRSY